MTKLMLVGLTLAGCASTSHPQPAMATTASLEHEANVTLGAMRAHDPTIDPVLRQSTAYVVFPDSGRRGVLFEYGKATGYVQLENPAGSSFSELLILKDSRDVEALKAGRFDRAGRDNVTVFVMPRGSRAVQLSSRDQRIDYLGT